MLNIQKNVKLSEHSTFKIGGPAKEFVEVGNEKELIKALKYADKNKMKFFVLGGGSNVLFDDKGYDGLVVKLKGNGNGIEIMKAKNNPEKGEAYGKKTEVRIKCWSGESFSGLVSFARDNNLSGLEWAVGIPGTVGGAIAGNAGAFGNAVGDLVENVKIFKILSFPFPFSKKVSNYNRKKCGFNYRNSIFKDNDKLVVLSAKFNLQKIEGGAINVKVREYIKQRMEKQPTGWYGSAGSFFKNPVVEKAEIIGKFERDKKTPIKDNKIPAGWIIEELGLKGKKVGGIMISDVNANFLINTGGGTAEEVIMAAGIIKQKAKMKFGIQLKEEVEYIPY